MTGCTVVPGIRMDHRPDHRFVPEGADAADFDFEVREINADVIRTQDPRVAPALNIGDVRSREQVTDDYEYRVGIGDLLMVVVWEHPDLTNPIGAGTTTELDQLGRLVREDGTMFFPYMGLIDVDGKSVEEIRKIIEIGLEPFVTRPQVDVRVVGFRSKRAYITGEVRDPGALPLEDSPMTVMDAINAASGFSEVADRRRAVLTRGEEQFEIDILNLYATGSGDLLLRDNDVLHIPDNSVNRVFMVGELERQIAVPLKDGRLSLAEAISEVEGLDLSRANTAEIYVIRSTPVRKPDGTVHAVRPEVYRLDARSAPALILADGFELQPRDVVFVSASPLVRFNRVVAQYVPIIQALWQTDRILRD
ncbi:polysaccharide biosynthesis/export family protein [Aquisalimonas sp.]|uniref:polysaccharide biosynthesis/export family protein n=1 Tax=Aquisalimonas sp. TaxID=1872621 RepID=UPI0025B86895|nr:polysaccharide biosynthesis/export family protein [Aquisalimonas sp.]